MGREFPSHRSSGWAERQAADTFVSRGGSGDSYNGGNVGIGTTTPVTPLDVLTSLSKTAAGPAAVFRLRTSEADVNNPFDLKVWVGGGATNAQRYFTLQTGEHNVINAGNLVFQQYGGNVGIGTTTPTQKLSVAGTIRAYEVIVDAGWSDYVFQPGYRLRPLSEINAFIKENHHLPDIPSEAEVKEKGIGVGEMQAKLLAKVEELTLHMIDADERSRRDEERSKSLEQQNRELRERITWLEAAGSDSIRRAK